MIMGKRTAYEANPKAPHDERHQKRQRVENSLERNAPAAVGELQVTTARQLQEALVFDQGSAAGFRSGLALFKKFLDSILYSTDDDDLPRKRAILREYLDTQKGKGQADKDTSFLPNFILGWDYAVESNFEALISLVTAALALLAKVFSSHADFLDYGTLLCKAVLQPSVARRLVRSLSAAPHQESIISPALRLLTELTRFNEGAFAKGVYAKKDFTLEPRILGRNIALWRDAKSDPGADLQRKPSVRITATRYLLTHLRYQDELAKREILSNTNIVRAVFDNVHADPPFLLYEIFNVFTHHVFEDKTIERQVKSRILTGRALSHIAALYRAEANKGAIPQGHKAPDELAHDFLCKVCTSPSYGVMLRSNGLYPWANDDDDGDAVMEDAEDLGIDNGADLAGTVEEQAPVRNVILGEFIQTLRPYANTLQQELVIAIFKANPELVADYFVQKQDFNYDPKLTSTWIGFSSFLYQTIELPVPAFFGVRRSYRAHPPPISTLLQSILPQPLTQQVLIRCLNHSSGLINIFAVRVLVVAFQKLRAVSQEMNTAAITKPSRSWQQARQRLVTAFSQRCPPMKAVTLASKKPNYQKDMTREAITRLLRLYYEVTPQVALQEKFDVSVPLCNALVRAEQSTEALEDKSFRVLELEHWIQIASYSPTTRWWQKNKPLRHSPFTTLLKLVAASPADPLYAGVRTLLLAILREKDIIRIRPSPNALDALIASLGAACSTSAPSNEVLDFLDDCCGRFLRGPIRYIDDLDSVRARVPASDAPMELIPVTPLLMTFVEQWPFKGGKAESNSTGEPLAQWLSKLLYLLKLIGEDEAVLGLVRDSLVESADAAYQGVLRDSFLWKMGKEKAKEALKLATGADFSGSERSSISPVPPVQPEEPKKPAATVELELPPQEDEKHAGLTRWKKKDMDESIDDGDVGNLLLCLCSKHTEIRLQAVRSIRQLMANIDIAEDSNLLQLKVLLGEAVETAQKTVEAKAFPYVGGVFAARCVSVLADPTHFLFPKINHFLMRGPIWTVENLLRYFGRIVINSPPDEDGHYNKEVEWYLDYLVDCLRTAEDMEIFRTNNIIERLLTFYASHSCAIAAKEKIVRLLLRAAAVGGSTTLITRCGLVGWIKIRLDNDDHRHRMLRQLAARLWGTCDQGKVNDWGCEAVGDTIAGLVKAGTN
ncbi:ribosome 60S biogenesis N-terminal-domain-containing protein [Massariosphaeria phaeospora]|uniref:Ribosome 60S biogenesis N-terminal-domain-containing protein n=1 Tax=Massariosphaeria phaeospora TaxID=100035 RepID=A0A7C8I5N0_9PLEO|nr:ribosome 60S biogenesis N-terminal-domain-containing protein [Massariosphaeria phaeospora]